MIPFGKELKQNQRLRLGLMLVVALLWFFALLELEDLVSAKRTTVKQLSGQITRTKVLAQDDRWQAYRDTVSRNLAQFRARAWREESEGRIQAHLQDWLRSELSQGKMKVKELVVSLPQTSGPPREGKAGVIPGEQSQTEGQLPAEMRLVHARLVLDFEEQQFQALLAKLSSSEHWLWVERLTVRNWGTRVVELELGALFVIGPRQEGI